MRMESHSDPVNALSLNRSLEEAAENRGFNRQALRGLSPDDQKKFESYGRGPDRQIPHPAIHQAFESQAQKHENMIAAQHKQQQITYGELNRKASWLAAELAAMGIGRGDNVGLFLERSIPMLTGLIGILKTGAAYVPQDVRITPQTTLADVMESAGIRVVLTLSHLADNIPVRDNQKVLAIDSLDFPQEGDRNYWSVMVPRSAASHHDNCFILFTSGTTGKPNGVQVTHGNVCNILLTEPGNLGIKPGYKVSQLLNIAFDMAAWEILGCLAQGGTLVIREKDFTEAVRHCDVVIATPSILAKVDVSQCHKIKTVAVAGEPCPRPLAEKWAAKCRFINSCGPTETTIINTAQHFRSHSLNLTIGKPTPNNTVYVLDEHKQPCAIGEVGEIWAGGKGVSAGYINNPLLNTERYQPDPFMADGSFMFRTRDLARWNEDGELEHFGRTDDQVKVKGFRVELDAISNTMESSGACQQAVTLKLNDKELVTFVRPANASIQKCLKAVESKLPYYCLPSSIVALPEFPVTARGKTDKRALLSMIQKKDSSINTRTEKEGVIA
ncbi:amino acid adenylation domain-containing protein [Endozoicomonas arenosclerae]|uniref:amino acid adenylation domain-containing protein n=1 Tax=Endozoicomonas arenosclerae TaxID=1633495 RepID=UPI000AE80BFF|nr:amino acid adenylation domain-containing protein [Endozoicomonas arenosclerae]